MVKKEMSKFYKRFLHPFLMGSVYVASIAMVTIVEFSVCYLLLNIFTWVGMPLLWAILASVIVATFVFVAVPFIIKAIINEASGSDKKAKCHCGNCKCGVQSGE